MEIKKRPLNTGETFCCSMKEAKEVFKDTAVFLDFAYLGRDYGTFARTPDRYYLQRKVTGRIVAHMNMYSKDKRPIIGFYVLKEKDFPSELRTEFEQKYLPEFYRLYNELFDDQSLISTTKQMMVELVDGKLKLHETVLPWR